MGLSEKFDFSLLGDTGPGNSDFGLAHGPGIDLRPVLPMSTVDLIGVDLTHEIHVDDFGSAAKGPAVKPGGGGGGSGGGGSGGGFTPSDYTTSGQFNIKLHFAGTWTEDLYNVFKGAADRLANFIKDDIPNVL